MSNAILVTNNLAALAEYAEHKKYKNLAKELNEACASYLAGSTDVLQCTNLMISTQYRYQQDSDGMSYDHSTYSTKTSYGKLWDHADHWSLPMLKKPYTDEYCASRLVDQKNLIAFIDALYDTKGGIIQIDNTNLKLDYRGKYQACTALVTLNLDDPKLAERLQTLLPKLQPDLVQQKAFQTASARIKVFSLPLRNLASNLSLQQRIELTKELSLLLSVDIVPRGEARADIVRGKISTDS